MTHSQALHQLYKEANTQSLEILIEEIQSSSSMQDVSIINIVEAMNQGAVQVEDLDPNNVGDEVVVRFPNNTYFFINLGVYETTDEGDSFFLESVDDLEDEVIEEYLARCEE